MESNFKLKLTALFRKGNWLKDIVAKSGKEQFGLKVIVETINTFLQICLSKKEKVIGQMIQIEILNKH